MDDRTRVALMTRLREAKERESQLLLRVRTHADNIDEIRKTLGNPFFYNGRPEGDPESKSRYTGYTSHEPGLQLVRECQEVAKEIESIQVELRAAGLDSD
jgi:hypothetical protein